MISSRVDICTFKTEYRLTRIDQSLRPLALQHTGCNSRIRGLFVFSNLSLGIHATHPTRMRRRGRLAAHDKRAEPRHPRSGAPIHPEQPRRTKGTPTTLTVAGNRKFESISLQQTVCLSPAVVFEGREPGFPRGSGLLAWRSGRQRR